MRPPAALLPTPTAAQASVAARPVHTWSSAAPRLLLLAGCAVALGSALRAGAALPHLTGDPALVRLLRGMALIKGAGVLAAVGAVLWRCGWRVSRPTAAAYLVGCWVMVGSTALIWRLALIPAAAIAFHAALFGLLIAAWRDDNKRGLIRASQREVEAPRTG